MTCGVNHIGPCRPSVCPGPIPDRFGMSPTLQIVPDMCTCHRSDGCTCKARCGCIDLRLDRDGRIMTNGQVTHHVLLRSIMRREARDSDVLPLNNCEDRGGWWAQSFGFPALGSRVWTIEASASALRDPTQEVTEMISESLADLVDISLIRDAEIDGTLDACRGELAFDSVRIRPPATPNGSIESWDWAWQTEGADQRCDGGVVG